MRGVVVVVEMKEAIQRRRRTLVRNVRFESRSVRAPQKEMTERIYVQVAAVTTLDRFLRHGGSKLPRTVACRSMEVYYTWSKAKTYNLQCGALRKQL